jgi:murein L,D-transpeptidase YafK
MRQIAAALVFFSLQGSAQANDRTVDRVHIKKSTHTLELLADKTIVKTYKVAIGPGGSGYKQREGDKVTPVGRYFVGHAIPSQFHLFMWVSYPNDADKKRFDSLKSEGKIPKDARIGGDIGIHGGGSTGDWTLGCIALEDSEIEEVARLTKDGAIVDIED